MSTRHCATCRCWWPPVVDADLADLEAFIYDRAWPLGVPCPGCGHDLLRTPDGVDCAGAEYVAPACPGWNALPAAERDRCGLLAAILAGEAAL